MLMLAHLNTNEWGFNQGDQIADAVLMCVQWFVYALLSSETQDLDDGWWPEEIKRTSRTESEKKRMHKS